MRQLLLSVCATLMFGAAAIEDAVLLSPLVISNDLSGPELDAFTIDADENRYLAGRFTSATDFNPFVGIDEKTPTGAVGNFFITRFNANGTYAWTQTIQTTLSTGTTQKIGALAVANGTVYVAGTAAGTVSIGSGTATPSIGSPTALNSFIAAVNAQTGAAVTTFGRDLGGGVRNGIQTLTNTVDVLINGKSALAADATGLYVTGTTNGSLILGNSEATLTQAGSLAFVLKLSLTTGSRDATFAGGNLLALFPATGVSLALSGSSLYVGGGLSSANPALTSGTSFTQSVSGTTAFALALNATSAAPLTTFAGDGLQVLPGGTVAALSAAGSSLFVSGGFSSTSLGIGTAGTVTWQGNTDVFVAKLTNGAADVAFASDGIVVFGSSQLEFAGNIAVSNGVVYCTAESFSGQENTVTLEGGTSVKNQNDAILIALDAANGAPKTNFSGDGIFVFGAEVTSENSSLVGVAGNSVVLAGFTNGFEPLGTVVYSVYVLPIPAATGVVDWTVNSTLSVDKTRETLSSAMKKARFGSTIRFDPTVFDLSNSFAATVINVGSLTELRDGGVTIDASDRRVTVNGSQGADGFVITSDGNVLKGLSIVGFPGSGVVIKGSGSNRPKNNVLGGDRSVGTGPNGSGLRITNCGSFGINITGADNNTIKGCWLGLDTNGDVAQPNLAGILVQNGSLNNVIGSAVAGEQNVVSSNTFEGITVSDAGSNGTTMIGNLIGVAAVESGQTLAVSRAEESGTLIGRSAAANGAAGIFLSKGTQANTVGGSNAGEANTIGFNGGSGIEVRAVASRRNSSKANRIARNKRGGIKLFDGSNDNITPPTFDGVDRLITRSESRAVNARVRVRGSSTSPDGSVIEVFRDLGDQGEGFIGRTNVLTGKWQLEAELLPDDNITATVTNLDGSTSAFRLFGSVPDVASGTPVISSATTIEGTLLTQLHYRITATPAADDFDALNLPAGLSIDNATGVISGTPTSDGVFVVDLTASNNNGTGSAQLTITVNTLAVGAPSITGTLAVSGMKGKELTYQILAGPTSTGVTYGASNLPPGLVLDPGTGLISGVPSVAGVYAVQLSASNSVGGSVTAATFTIFSTENAGSAAATDSDGDGISDAVELLAETDPLSAASKPEVAESARFLSKTSLSLSFTSAKDKFKTSTLVNFSDVPTKVSVMVGGLMETVLLDSKLRGTNGVLTVAVKRSTGLLSVTISAGNTDLDTAFGSLGFTNKTTTGRTGEVVPITLFLRVVGASDIVYACQANLVYKATAGKSGKAAQAK